LAIFAIDYNCKPSILKEHAAFLELRILASLTNKLVLILLSICILYEGFMRIFAPPNIQGFLIIVAAVIGLIVNFIGMRLLIEGKGDKGHSHVLYEMLL
jgi:cobalt-zinc-cadmium efflux system protein